MYIVYFNNKTIRFDRVAHIEGSLRIDGGTLLRMVDIAKLLQIIENSDSIEILSEDFEAVFAHFCSFFIEVEAAGGVVADGEGRVVMIFRRKRWDLPKGHLDEGESLAECAAREVCEECGLEQVAVDELICPTLHIYNTYGRWELKRTWWYAMRCESSTATTPQSEEDIECVEWCELNEALRRAQSESYPTIAKVMQEYKIMQTNRNKL